ncbi:MAG: helix-turn-helix transcriptional regulator [Bacilli bacterium]|nr:helix-turn-helix transcriptional regulator [Bacilli bacterium]
MTIGERLLKLRKEKNLSQEDLANILDVSRQTVSKWETGESMPDFNKICPLCEYFGITSDELITGKQNIIEARKENKKEKFARNIAVAVGLYILSLVAIILFSTTFNNPEIGVCIFFGICAVATGLIIYSSILYSKDKEQKEVTKEEKKEVTVIKQICEIIDIIGIVVYFLVSFGTGAWHITWIIFLVIGLCKTIAKLIYGLKHNDEKEVKVEEENE